MMNSRRHALCFIATACGALAVCDAALAEVSPTTALQQRLCPGGAKFVDHARLLSWIDGMNNLFFSDLYGPDADRHLIGVLDDADVASVGAARKQYHADLVALFMSSGQDSQDANKTADATIETIRSLRQDLHTMSLPAPADAKRAYYGTDNFDVDAWLAQGQSGAMQIVCNPAFGKHNAAGADAGKGDASSVLSFDRFRIRGTPDSLAIYRDDSRFGNADKASISYSYDGLKKTRTDVVQATIGFDLLPAKVGVNLNDYAIVLYGAVNRNVSTAGAGPAKFSTRYADFGVSFSLIDTGVDSTGASWINTFTAAPHYLMNDLDGSRLAGFHFQDLPTVNLPFHVRLNDFTALDGKYLDDTVFAISPNIDFRGDADFFTDRGSAAATNLDYVRLGTSFGFTLKFNPFGPDMLGSDIAVVDTWMYGATGTLQHLNDFQASWTLHFDPKYFGLSFAYKSGRIEATGNKEQSLTVALTGKY